MISLLFRNNLETEDEFNICKQYFSTYEYRTEIPENSIVIGRYSVLPYYDELEKELKLHNSKLINSYSEHKYIADIMNYYPDVKDFTFPTYSTWGHLTEEDYPMVIKGRTNSRKFLWNTHMFIKSKQDLSTILNNVLNDELLSQQGIIMRKYIELDTFCTSIQGLPITKEWRLFYYKDNLLAHGFYWSSFSQFSIPLEQKGIEFANKIAKIISESVNFFVLDIALTKKQEYILVECNDGQMSGLSECNPNELYKNLSLILNI